MCSSDLENFAARKFYESHGYVYTGNKKEFSDSGKYLLNYENQKHNQMLSEFATKQIQEAIERRCWKEGYGVVQVNPAYTSQIGREKYSRKMGCTVHLAASFVIARRGMGYQN